MSSGDLTPRTYLKRCRSRTALQRWVAVACMCAVASSVPIGIESARAPDRTVSVARERMAQAQNRYIQSEAAAAQMSHILKQSERELQAESLLTRRPNWSELLRRVALQFEGKMMMSGFRLGTVADPQVRASLGQVAADVPADSIWLVLIGVAGANSDVPGLIIRLEELGLFDRVVMTGTKRELYAGAPRTGFVLACRIQ